jgi:conjugative relaxase-like TrwC/TraI family protein
MSMRIMATRGPVVRRRGSSRSTTVLSIGRLGVASGADYYLERIANSIDDYYLGRGEAPGQWIGATSDSFGLRREVDAVALRNLLDGHGANGEDLGIMRRGDRRPGFDLTFSAPKGLSLLWAFGSPEVRDAVSSAHDRALAGVVDHLSAEAAHVRRGANGLELLGARGFVAAGFRHRTSRAGDPQLHTHVLVPNVTLGHDGRWSAPDARQLYAWQKAATAMYHSALRADLAPLGLSWNVGRNSLGELSDIPRSVLRAFSKRRVDIEASLEEMGLRTQRAAEVAALATRGPKAAHVAAPDVLRAGWAEQLSDIAVNDETGSTRPATLGDITRALAGAAPAPMSDAQRERTLALLAGEKPVDLANYDLADPAATRVTPLTLFASTFTYRDALAAVARAVDAAPGEVAALTEQLLRREGVVRLMDRNSNQIDISGRGTERPAASAADRRYSTREMLRIEGRIVNSAVARLGGGGLPRSLIDPVLAQHGQLDGEQLAGVRRLVESGNGVDLVIGQAGTGKSTMLGAAREIWEAAGYRVIGTAVASRTAADLEAGTGIASATLARFFIDLEHGETQLGSHDVVVVDEASLVGSRTLDRLQHQVDLARAKLVLVGDNRQLSSIDAGGALRALSRTLGPEVIELTTNRRQSEAHQEWERQALVDLRTGEVARAVAAYDAHDRIVVAEKASSARQALLEQWWSVHEEATTAILAVTRGDVAALNLKARERRREAGELGAEIRLASGKAFAVGDRIMFEKNARAEVADRKQDGPKTVATRNGTFATVMAVADQRQNSAATREGDVGEDQGDVGGPARHGAVVAELDSGQRVTLTERYLEESTSLGYALTVFRSQGVTVDHCFLLADDTLFQEAGYTALSRGRLSNHLFAVDPQNPRAEIAHGDEAVPGRDALASLADSLSHSHEQVMALETLPTSTFGDDAPPPSHWSDGSAARSAEERFCDWARNLDRIDQRPSEPPGPVEFDWSRDDRGHEFGRDAGFGL